MDIPLISPDEAHKLIDSGQAVLADIREPDEHARENIPGSRLTPLSRIASTAGTKLGGAPAVIFHCQSGKRTCMNFPALQSLGLPRVYVLDGGVNGWKAAGLPVRRGQGAPLPLQRQVQIAAGLFVLLGLALAALVSVWFVLLSGFVGTGLVFAGLSGWCGMAELLARMPWNRTAPA